MANFSTAWTGRQKSQKDWRSRDDVPLKDRQSCANSTNRTSLAPCATSVRRKGSVQRRDQACCHRASKTCSSINSAWTPNSTSGAVHSIKNLASSRRLSTTSRCAGFPEKDPTRARLAARPPRHPLPRTFSRIAYVCGLRSSSAYPLAIRYPVSAHPFPAISRTGSPGI